MPPNSHGLARFNLAKKPAASATSPASVSCTSASIQQLQPIQIDHPGPQRFRLQLGTDQFCIRPPPAPGDKAASAVSARPCQSSTSFISSVMVHPDQWHSIPLQHQQCHATPRSIFTAVSRESCPAFVNVATACASFSRSSAESGYQRGQRRFSRCVGIQRRQCLPHHASTEIPAKPGPPSSSAAKSRLCRRRYANYPRARSSPGSSTPSARPDCAAVSRSALARLPCTLSSANSRNVPHIGNHRLARRAANLQQLRIALFGNHQAHFPHPSQSRNRWLPVP